MKKFKRDFVYSLLGFLWHLSALAFMLGVIGVVFEDFNRTLITVGAIGAIIFIPSSIYMWSNKEARQHILFWLLPI